MKLKKPLTSGVVTLLSVTTLVACGGSRTSNSSSTSGGGKASGEQILCVTEQREMSAVGLSLATGRVSFIVLNNVYEGICCLNKDNKVRPADAAEKAEVSEDRLTYKIKLNKDARWSDDEPVTANDYVYGWQRMADPTTALEYTYLYTPVKNGDTTAKGEKDKSELGTKAVSDTELEVALKKATPYFDYLLVFPSFLP